MVLECISETEQQSLSIVQTVDQSSSDVCLPELQFHSPPVQKDGGGFIVDTWTEEGRQRRALGEWMHQEGQHQSRLQNHSQKQAGAQQKVV